MPPPKDPMAYIEYCKKLSILGKGHVVSDATRKKQSDFAKSQPQTEQKRNKLSLAHKGKIISELHKQRLREVKTGVPIPECTRLKISSTMKGVPKSNIAKENIRKNHVRGELHPLYHKRPSKETLDKQLQRKIGSKSYLWKGGISFFPYCPKFNKDLKRRVRLFFSDICVGCGKTKEENGSDLIVHHVNYDKMVCCNDTKPLFVALCKSCHSKSNHNRDMWNTYYESIINTFYNGKCYIELSPENFNH